jgi:hypothetical protein
MPDRPLNFSCFLCLVTQQSVDIKPTFQLSRHKARDDIPQVSKRRPTAAAKRRNGMTSMFIFLLSGNSKMPVVSAHMEFWRP